MIQKIEQVIELKPEEIYSFCGKNDRTLRIIEEQLSVKIVPRGNYIKMIGSPEAVEDAKKQINKLLEIHRREGGHLAKKSFEKMIGGIKENGIEIVEDFLSSSINVPLKRKRITPLSLGQRIYIEAIKKDDIVFGIGPAGTGKTYLAMAMAVWSLASERVARIILVRPAVEAGERLGFLPGDIAEKFDPYVRPLYDALFDMMESEKVQHYRETGIIEIAPLAFMRGRTLNNAFVILDEGQNTSIDQMKMFLTRLGPYSKAVVTGDITQTDLPENSLSGLIHVQSVLKDIEGISFIYLDEKDIVRHELVRKIVLAYEKAGKKESITKKGKDVKHPEFLGETTYQGLIQKLGSPAKHPSTEKPEADTESLPGTIAGKYPKHLKDKSDTPVSDKNDSRD